MMGLGLGFLRWSPADFWRATPREVLAAFAALTDQSPPPVLKGDLMGMIERFPDAL
ncbi:phage tail assembly chaperone [Microvirga sp. WGZ8]|uniref:Phage tail assembly chaperone n=2 Tax=Microvirga puerhi TaxID=2876078 RepID=A0ABS7VLI9_9HYPH|nr:phage tail assembly chaperone [Microvirga puerhi]